MAGKSKKKKQNKSEKQDVYVGENTIELEKASQDVAEEVVENVDEPKKEELEEKTETVNTKIDEIVQEYNGDPKENTQMQVRDSAEMKKFKKKNKKVFIITGAIILVISIAFTALCIVNKMNSNVYKNIFVNGENVSGMSSAQLSEYLKKEQEALNNASLKVIQENEEILEVVPADMDFQIDVASVESDVFNYGRSSNVIKNNIDIIYAQIFKKNFELKYKYDVSKLTDVVKEIKESLNNKIVQDSFVINEKEYKLIITRGKSGNTIEEDVVKDKIISGLSNGMGEYNLDIVVGKPDPLDIDVVYSKVKREAKDAYIDKSSSVYKFVPHQVGLDFDKKDLENVLAKTENQEEGKVIEYKLTVKEPKVKTSDIKWNVYEYKISSYTTYFTTGDANRVNNLRVALNLLNGKVIMPGETFSYNSVVGAATTAQGFKPAATFVGGRVTSEVGGGICQTVSTLYNTALLANLEIVQRKAHSLPVAYVPGSRDATVYYPSIDFKFKNTRSYPIKIVTSFNKGGNLTISLYGTKEENEYDISISSRRTATVPFTTQYVNDNTLAKGTQKVIQNGSNGYKSEAYITKKLNGKVVSTTLLSKDTYKAVNKVVKVGTKEVQTTAPVVTTPGTPTSTGTAGGESTQNTGN